MKEIQKIAGFAPSNTVDRPIFWQAGLFYAPAFYVLVATLAAIASASGLLIRSTQRVDSHARQEMRR